MEPLHIEVSVGLHGQTEKVIILYIDDKFIYMPVEQAERLVADLNEAVNYWKED